MASNKSFATHVNAMGVRMGPYLLVPGRYKDTGGAQRYALPERFIFGTKVPQDRFVDIRWIQKRALEYGYEVSYEEVAVVPDKKQAEFHRAWCWAIDNMDNIWWVRTKDYTIDQLLGHIIGVHREYEGSKP